LSTAPLTTHIELPLSPGSILLLGVVSDTHIPDRGLKLHPALVRMLASPGVTAILHAGDIAAPAVLAELGEIAPVIAVQGNRDWLFRKSLPAAVRLTIGPVKIGLVHGHGGLRRYLIDKARYLASGYRVERYRNLVRSLFPQVQAIVYGHTHRADNTVQDGCLYFNPGAAGGLAMTRRGPSIGFIRVGPGDQVQGEIVFLNEYRDTDPT